MTESLYLNGFTYEINLDTGKAAISFIDFFTLFKKFPDIPKIITHKRKNYEVNSIICNIRFCGDKNIDLITIPDHITELSSGIFQRCRVKKVILGTGLTNLPFSCFQWSEIEEVVFKPGSKITTIGEDCFAGCTNLRKIVLPNSIRNLGRFSFWNCCNLEEISLPSLDSIGESSFTSCKNLKRVFFRDKLPPTERLINKTPTRIFSSSNRIVKPTLYIPDSEIENMDDRIASNPCLNIQAYRVSTNELYTETLKYEILDPKKKECGVTFNLNSSGNNIYSGNIIVPNLVILNGSVYKVVKLLEFSFYGCNNLLSIEITKDVVIDSTALEENSECLIILRGI